MVDFVAAGQKFELTVINPSVVMGPPLQSSTCTSIEVCVCVDVFVCVCV